MKTQKFICIAILTIIVSLWIFTAYKCELF
jgi:hypothetical protein